MEQGDLPVIHGADWHPQAPLEFIQQLHADTARSEVLRFVTQRHDGHLFLVATVWDHMIGNEPKQFEGPSWYNFSERFLIALERAMKAQINSKMEGQGDVEVIPRRTLDDFLDRRNTHFIIDMRLTLRRLAHYMSVTIEQRLEWQRLMERTRYLDAQLKNIFTEGIETPDGSKFGGKGFRSTWQEGVVAVATALNRQIDAPRG